MLRFSEPHALELIKLEEFTLVNTEERQRDNGEKDVDPKLNERLNLFGHYLHQKYVVPTYPKSEFTYYNVWDGVDKDNQGWHIQILWKTMIYFSYTILIKLNQKQVATFVSNGAIILQSFILKKVICF